MDDLPAFWTVPIGVIAGYLYIGRVARWLQYVRATMGKSADSFGVEARPSTGRTLFAIVAYPTPWIAVGLAAWGIYHAVTVPMTNEWRWFYAGFFGGPLLTIWWLVKKMKAVQLQRKQQSQALSEPDENPKSQL
jgi:hypothetical protein